MRRPTAIPLMASGVVAAIAESFPSMPPDQPRFTPACPPRSDCKGVTCQWNLLDYSPVAGIPHASGISATAAWQTTLWHPAVVIGVLDSGVNYDQEYLRDKIWLNRGELPV